MFWMSKSTLGGFVKMQKEKDRHGLWVDRQGIEIKKAMSGGKRGACGSHGGDGWSFTGHLVGLSVLYHIFPNCKEKFGL